MKSLSKCALIKLSVLLCFAGIISAVFSACACIQKEDPKEPSTSLAETEEEAVTETEIVSGKEEETTTEEVQTESTSESEAEEDVTCGYFFGKRMDEWLLNINKNMLSDPESRLADILGENTYTAADVLNMIRYYSFPESDFYGDRPDILKVQNELTEYQNLGILEEMRDTAPEETLDIRYGILTDNASVRSFPTDLRAYNEGDSTVWDYFQETRLLYGDGVIVLHETPDAAWSFVQGLNYFGWVRTENVAFCGFDVFLDYLTMDQYLVRIRVLPGDPSPLNRLGVILPITEDDPEKAGCTVLLPKREEDGSLTYYEQFIDASELSAFYHEGFLEFSPDAVLEEARHMLGYPYGYGDLNSNYDCSSFAGLVYRCFGVFLPRNSVDIPHAKGLTILDVTDFEDPEKAQVVMDHPGAILAWPGHVMMSAGRIDSDTGACAGIIHCNTAYYDTPDGDPRHLVVTEKVTEALASDIYRANGQSFLSAADYVIWLEPKEEQSSENSKEN